MYILNLKVCNKLLSFCDSKNSRIRVVGDNKDYVLHFETDIGKQALFALFKRDGKESPPVLLDENGNAPIPIGVLKDGHFEVGLYADGYATTPLYVPVEGSILNDDDIPLEEIDETQVEQLIGLVNGIFSVKKAEIDEDGKLLVTMANGQQEEITLDAGTARGNGIRSFEQTESDKDGGENTVTVTFTNGEATVLRFLNGRRGNGIEKMEQTETSGDSGGVNRFTFTTTDGEEAVFEVRNGAKGDKGDAATIKSVRAETGEPGSEATAANEGTSSDAEFVFRIPKGDKGDKGNKGDKGDTGETPQLSLGTVTTVEPDEPASATLTGSKEKPVLNLTIPKGEKGTIEGIAVTTSKTVTVGKDSAVTLDSEIESQEVQLQWKIPGVRVIPPFTNYFLASTKFTYPRSLTSGYNQFWSSSAAHGNADAFVSGHSYLWAFRFEMDGDSTVGIYNPGNKYVTPDGSTTLTGSGWAYQLASPVSATGSYFMLNNLSGTGRIVYTYCIDITALQETYSDVPSTVSDLAVLFAELPLVPGQDFEGTTSGGEDTVFLTVTRGEESFTLDCLTTSATLQGGDVLQTSAGSVTFGISLTKIFRQERRLTGKKWVAFGDSTTDPTINATKKYCDYIAEETGVTLVNMGKGGTGYWRTNENGTAFYQRAKRIPADTDVITCFGSINDWKYAISGLEIGTASDTLESGTICGYINGFINVCRQVAPYAQIALISMQPSTGINVTLMDNLNNAIKSVAAYRKIKFLDLWNESGLRTDDSVKAYYFTDPESEVMCHPSNEGHRLIYPDILQLLCRMIGSI